jgi:hypothetical protein
MMQPTQDRFTHHAQVIGKPVLVLLSQCRPG